MRNDIIKVVAQKFYGNRTTTTVERDRIGLFLIGRIEGDFLIYDEKIDKTVIMVPNTDNLCFVYNKYKEEKELQKIISGKNVKPSIVIGDNDIVLYSRVIVCRINKDGEFESLTDNDYERFMDYLCK